MPITSLDDVLVEEVGAAVAPAALIGRPLGEVALADLLRAAHATRSQRALFGPPEMAILTTASASMEGASDGYY